MIGRKKKTLRHMASTKSQEAGFGSARKSTIFRASRTAVKAMISEAPSSTPRMGRKESLRNSKKASTQACLPRTPPARASALMSSADLLALEAPAFAISGSCMMSL